MCGLVGFYTKQPHLQAPRREALFVDALIGSRTRGRHATGMAYVKSMSTEVDYVKKAMDAKNFVDWKGFLMAMDGQHRIIMAHTRAATDRSGSQYDREAHPFAVDHITLSHNGYISNHDKLDAEIPGIYVDSSRAACAIAKYGEIEALEMFDGQYALSWLNQQDNTLNFASNGGRHLFFTEPNEEDTIWWASEPRMLNWLFAAYGMTEKVDANEIGYTEYAPHRLVKIHYEDQGRIEKIDYKPDPTKAPKYRASHRPYSPAGVNTQATSTGKSLQVSSGTSETGIVSVTVGDDPSATHGAAGPMTAADIKKYLPKFKDMKVRKLQRIMSVLRELKVPLNKVIGVTPDNWESYGPAQIKGQINGVVMDVMSGCLMKPQVHACVQNVDSSLWKQAIEDDMVIGHVINVRKDEGNDYWTIVVEHEPIIHATIMKYKGVAKERAARDKEEADTMVAGPGNAYVTMEVFKRLVKEGCGNCSDDIGTHQADLVSWVGQSPVCPTCTARGDFTGGVSMI